MLNRPGSVLILHGNSLPDEIVNILTASQYQLLNISGKEKKELQDIKPALFIVDSSNSEIFKQQYFQNTITLSEQNNNFDVDLVIPHGFPLKDSIKIIQFAVSQYQLKLNTIDIQNTLHIEQQRLKQLTDIGIALSQQKNLGKLLQMILNEAQALSNCDAVSLFLVDKRHRENPELVFKLAQNTSMKHLNFEEKHFPLNNQSIAGYCANNNEIVNIRNAYQIIDEPFSFDPSFDKLMNYRTVSILAIPITNNSRETIGVLQFINRKLKFETILDSLEVIEQNVIVFDKSMEVILSALAGQAGIAIENSVLLDDINNLLNGFVHASVTAIEQRDPTTSGHSFRVADLTCGLADSLHRTNLNDYNKISYSEKELREIRFAALLHDFGKVGVREHVLVKPKKLQQSRLDVLEYRFELEKARFHKEIQEKIIQSLHHGYDANAIQALKQELTEKTVYLDRLFETILNSNEPSILPEGDFRHLQTILTLPFISPKGEKESIITEEDFKALSVRKGSLTYEERIEIQSHVVHTYNFLTQIPWTTELKSVPDYAQSHHEKLNGTGYPQGLKSEEIPFPSKIMAICDIFDALVAKDRPYKKALPMELALRIIESEADDGFLDRQLVDIFMHAKIYEITTSDSYSIDWEKEQLMKQRTLCDVKLK